MTFSINESGQIRTAPQQFSHECNVEEDSIDVLCMPILSEDKSAHTGKDIQF